MVVPSPPLLLGFDALAFLIRVCTVTCEKPGHRIPALAADVETRRKRHTVEKGKSERLLWSDETARAILVSKFVAKP